MHARQARLRRLPRPLALFLAGVQRERWDGSDSQIFTPKGRSPLPNLDPRGGPFRTRRTFPSAESRLLETTTVRRRSRAARREAHRRAPEARPHQAAPETQRHRPRPQGEGGPHGGTRSPVLEPGASEWRTPPEPSPPPLLSGGGFDRRRLIKVGKCCAPNSRVFAGTVPAPGGRPTWRSTPPTSS